VYTAGRPTGPCTRSQMARYSHVRPVTACGPCTGHVHVKAYAAVYTIRVHEHLHSRVRIWPVYTAVYWPCTRPSMGPVGPCRRPCTCRICGPCKRTCTRLCMGRVHDRVHGALRPCTRPTAATCRLGPCTRPCRSTCHVHDCVLAVYTDVYMARKRPFNCGVDVCTCRTAV